MSARLEPAFVGVADHGGWAILITVSASGALLDRRRVELVELGLPALPHHHDAQGLPAAQGVALVERVAASAARCASAALERLAAEVPAARAIVLRERPPLPPTIEERIRDYRAQCVADWVMYRDALAGAARERGWVVERYDAKTVAKDLAAAIGGDVEALLAAPRARLGPPWQKDHRTAMAAALLAAHRHA